MNPEWLDFLKSTSAATAENSTLQSSNTVTAITDLAIIEVSGKDAAQFLQGQLTCNINELTASNSFFAAFCNAKGRTISTLLILKNNESFLLILALELLEKVIAKLRMYILRADVQLHNRLNNYCLMGLNSTDTSVISHCPGSDFEVSNHSEITVKIPVKANRYLLISGIDRAKQLWTELTQTQALAIAEPSRWRYQDISSGLPWLDQESSEQYIPQMLNIDKLGGISFQKGCYTGQEIIARTHYLGKTKRELFLAECDKTALIENHMHIIDNNKQQSVGNIISLQTDDQNCRMLIVIPSTASESNNLSVDNSTQDKIKLIAFQ
jgi:folate-binding protein YgfZ